MRKEKMQYLTLEELRADKRKVGRKLSTELTQLQDDVVSSFLPERSYIDSTVPYMRYVGYGLTAYKTAKTVKRLFDFVHKRNWI